MVYGTESNQLLWVLKPRLASWLTLGERLAKVIARAWTPLFQECFNLGALSLSFP